MSSRAGATGAGAELESAISPTSNTAEALYLADLLPFTRKPFFLVVDSPNSQAFAVRCRCVVVVVLVIVSTHFFSHTTPLAEHPKRLWPADNVAHVTCVVWQACWAAGLATRRPVYLVLVLAVARFGTCVWHLRADTPALERR